MQMLTHCRCGTTRSAKSLGVECMKALYYSTRLTPPSVTARHRSRNYSSGPPQQRPTASLSATRSRHLNGFSALQQKATWLAAGEADFDCKCSLLIIYTVTGLLGGWLRFTRPPRAMVVGLLNSSVSSRSRILRSSCSSSAPMTALHGSF